MKPASGVETVIRHVMIGSAALEGSPALTPGFGDRVTVALLAAASAVVGSATGLAAGSWAVSACAPVRLPNSNAPATPTMASVLRYPRRRLLMPRPPWNAQFARLWCHVSTLLCRRHGGCSDRYSRRRSRQPPLRQAAAIGSQDDVGHGAPYPYGVPSPMPPSGTEEPAGSS